MVNIKSKKGVELALNTIVVAILIIIVLLVIVLIFTGKIGQTNEALEQSSGTACSITNPALATLGYKQVDWVPKGECPANLPIEISVIPDRENPTTKINEMCCGQK